MLGWTERGSHMRNMYCSLLICSSCLTWFLRCGFKSSCSCTALLYIFSQEETLSLIIMWFWCVSNFVPSLTTCYCCHQRKHFCPNHIFSDCSTNTHIATVLDSDVVFVHCYFQKGNHIARLYFPLIFGLLLDWFLSSSHRLFSLW